MLCDKLALDRIAREHYEPFINKIFTKRWKGGLRAAFYDALFQVTEAHPYYVNLLCGRLYTGNTMPDTRLLQKVWHSYVQEEKSKVALELSKLSLLQKKVIATIALGAMSGLTSKDVLQKLGSTSASVLKALRELVAKDYIQEVAPASYSIVDPLIKASIVAYYSVDEYLYWGVHGKI